MIIYRSCIATSHRPAKYLWSPEKCVFRSLPILITELAPPTHPWITRPLPFGMWWGGKSQRPPFPQPPRPTTHLNATLILAFAPASQVSPATQAACHHMGMCRAPPPSRPTITRSPRVWMGTALLPCPIWAAPRPSSTAQLPTHPMPVSKDVCPVFLHIFLLQNLGVVLCWLIVQPPPCQVWTQVMGPKAAVSPAGISALLAHRSPVSLAELACDQSSNVRSLWEPKLPVRWSWVWLFYQSLTGGPEQVHLLSQPQCSYL